MDFNLGVANDFATTSQYLLVIRDESDRQVKQLYLQFLSSILDLLMDDNLYEIVNTDLDAESWTFTEKAEKVEVEGGALIGFEQGQENALLQLADLDFPIYLTTSYHGLLETALRRANKEPQVEYFRWNDRLKLAPPLLDKNFEPSPQQPLVYHLHGIDSEPSSLVLTEEDHLEFLIFLRNEIETIMPVAVREALINDSLLMLGFQPEAWDFKILFHGLIKQRLNPPKSVCVQVSDTGPNILYVENYLRQAKFEVIWDDTFHFLKKLWQEVKE
jgi:hypothetical protein